MRYNVAQLLRGPVGTRRHYDFCEDVGNLESELVQLQPLVGSITLTRTNQGILVEGLLQTTLGTECRRCLAPSQVGVEIELEELFHPEVQIPNVSIEELPEEDQDEALMIDAHHILDLEEVVRQGLWVSAPMDSLCRKDCAGLCEDCGGNRNLNECLCYESPIDPRWAVLGTLQPAVPDSSERSD